MQLWVHTKSPIIGNKLGLIDVRPTGAALGLVDNGFAQFANSGGNSLLPVVDGDTEWKGWQAIVEADGNLPVNISLYPPDITGIAAVSETITCDEGTWVGTQPITFTYRWMLDRTPIIGETENTYVVRAEDSGHSIECLVKATNSVGSSIEVSNALRIMGARYDYKTLSSTPASGMITSGSWSAPLQVRVSATDKDGRDVLEYLLALQVGDSIIVGTQEGVLTELPIYNPGYVILEVDAWPLLADDEYIVMLKFA